MPTRYCVRCQAIHGAICPQAVPRQETTRPSAAKRGYDGSWRKARAAYLADNPICVRCGKGATVVDHIVPHRGDADVFWDSSNWQSLCTRCHGHKTGLGE